MKNYLFFKNLLLFGIVFFVLVKFFFDFFVPFTYNDNGIQFSAPTIHKDYGAITPIDDPEIVETAIYYNRGMGFLTGRSFNRPNFRKENVYKTAFRPKFSTYMHIAGVWLYAKYHPNFHMEVHRDMPSDYYYVYGVILLLLKWLFFVPAVYAFYLLLARLTRETVSLIFTFLFVIYPSNYYVGLLNVFEPIITYLTVIILSFLCLGIVEKTRHTKLVMVVGSLAVLFCVWMKPHVLFYVFFFLLVAAWQSFVWKRWTKSLTMCFLFFVVSILAQVPILISNYKDFGKVFLANQAGIDFFHAHNPYARGCWTPALFQNHGKELMAMITQNKELPLYNEKQEADYYQQMAVKWIVEHPLDELELIGRKFLIFFLPHNFMSLKINFLTLFVHLGLLVYLFFFFKDKRYRVVEDWYILCVIAAVLLLNVIYFVEYRWRFFADPELILLAGIGCCHLWLTFETRREPRIAAIKEEGRLEK